MAEIVDLHGMSQMSSLKLIQFVLVFCLVLGGITGVVPSINAQSPAPNSREAVEVEIKKYAARHVENDQPMATSTVMKAFEKNAANLTTADVITIYEEEFVKLKKVKDEDFWEQVKPKAGWIVAAMITIFALFREKLTAWVETIVGALEKGIYQRFSGTKLFWNVALRKYRSALVEKHQSLKIPFRPNRPLELAGIYVPLKVAGNRTEPSVEALQVIRGCRKLMVKGQPGSGKTILLKYLALNYGLGELRLKDDPIVILLELHRLSGEVEVLPALVEALGRDDFPNGTKFLEQALDSGRVVLLLDGLDEVNTSDRSSVVKRIKDFFDRYGKCGVVITCRSQVYQNEFDEVVDRTLEVVEFTDAQIQQFLRPWKAEMPPEKSVQQLLQSLRDRPRIKELARNPLLLTIIAYLYCDTPFVLPHSRSEFYSKSTDILLESWDQARQTPNIYKGFTKRSVLQHLALFAQDSKGDRKTLSYKDVMTQVKAVLPGLNLDADRDVEPILNELVDRTGLLLRIDGGARYQFSHLTLQEFFAAGALSDRSNDLIQRVENDPDAWREVVKLWCGSANDSTAVIRQIYVSQPVMAFECLADAQNVDAALADEIIDRFQGELRSATQDVSLPIVQAFGSVAANSRNRGKTVFEFLVNICQTPQTSVQVDAATTALAFTNSPSAVKALIQLYPKPEARLGLLQLGDLAVEALGDTQGTHLENRVDDLMAIGTPEAARKMVQYLWNENPLVSTKAAWNLSVLLTDREVEESLHSTRLSVRQCDGKNDWVWIWEPFDKPTSSRLPRITARIADLLSTNKLPSQPITNSPDLRLFVPICAFSEDFTNNLPKILPSEVEGLLSIVGRDEGPVLIKKFEQLEEELLRGTSPDSTWKELWNTRPLEFRLHFLSCLITGRKVTPKDWLNRSRPVTYDFQEGWHYRLVLSVAVMISIAALIEMFYLPFQSKEQWTSWLLGLPVLVVVDSWIFLWKGIGNQLESDLFLKFGALGAIEFWYEIKHFLKDNLIKNEIKILFEIFIRDIGLICLFLGAFTGALIGLAVKISDINMNIFIAFIAISAFLLQSWGQSSGKAGVKIFALNCAAIALAVFAFIFLFKVSFEFVVSFSVLVPVSITVLISISISIAGLGFWSVGSKASGYSRYFAIFSYPLFCAFPIVLIYSSLGLQNFFPWQTVALIWFTIITVCTLLWQRGQHLDRAAQNPFQKILTGYYESPIPLAPLKRGNRSMKERSEQL